MTIPHWESLFGATDGTSTVRAYYYLLTTFVAAALGFPAAMALGIPKKYPWLFYFTGLGVMYGIYDHVADFWLYQDQLDELVQHEWFWGLHPRVAYERWGDNAFHYALFRLVYFVAGQLPSFYGDYLLAQALWTDPRVPPGHVMFLKYSYFCVDFPLVILGDVLFRRSGDWWECFHPPFHAIHHVIGKVYKFYVCYRFVIQPTAKDPKTKQG